MNTTHKTFQRTPSDYRQWTPNLFSILLLLFAVIPALADTASDLAEARRQKAALEGEIKKLDVRVVQTDSLSRDETRRAEDLQKRNESDIARRRSELDSLQRRIAEAASQVQSEKNRQGAELYKVENAKAYRTAVAKTLADQCKLLEAQIESSLPWDRQERLDRVRALRRDLESGNAQPEEGLSRLRAIYTEEIRMGDEVILVNKPVVRNDGETVNARLMRIGNQWMIYSDEEGNRFGILSRKNTAKGVEYSWKEDLNFEERQAVKLAIDVKLARKPPQIVRLPLSVQGTEEVQP